AAHGGRGQVVVDRPGDDRVVQGVEDEHLGRGGQTVRAHVDPAAVRRCHGDAVVEKLRLRQRVGAEIVEVRLAVAAAAGQLEHDEYLAAVRDRQLGEVAAAERVRVRG